MNGPLRTGCLAKAYTNNQTNYAGGQFTGISPVIAWYVGQGRNDILYIWYCQMPAGWGLQQTTLAPGSDKTWGQGPFSPLTGGLT